MSTQAADPLVASSAGSADSSQPKPVGAEIPVLVQGSRPASPGQRPQPFAEESRTMVVFPRGAVLPISGTVTNGQLLILKNNKTSAEVACKVVRANEKIKGYYEVEFTQPEPTFWGLDFPSGGDPSSSSQNSAGSTPAAQPATEADLAASTEELMEDLDRALASAFASLPKSTPKAPETPKSAEAPAPRVGSPASSIPANTIAIADSVSTAPKTPPASPRAAAPHVEAPKIPSKQELESVADFVASDVAARPSQPLNPPVAPRFESHASAPGKTNWMWVVGGAAAAAVLLAAGTFVYRTYFRGKPSDILPPVTTAASNPSQTPETGASNAAGVSTPGVQQGQPSSDANAREKAAGAPADETTTVVTATASRHNATILDRKIKAPQSPVKYKQTANAADPSALALQVPAQTTLAAASLGSLMPAGDQPAPPPAPIAARVSNMVQAKLISSVPPIYPQMAAAQGLKGDVTLDLTVSETGKVTDAKVVSGPALLRQSATDAARQWKYSPAKLDGTAIATHVNVVVHFNLTR